MTRLLLITLPAWLSTRLKCPWGLPSSRPSSVQVKAWTRGTAVAVHASEADWPTLVYWTPASPESVGGPRMITRTLRLRGVKAPELA